MVQNLYVKNCHKDNKYTLHMACLVTAILIMKTSPTEAIHLLW
jgi:hypothetical protein